MQDFEPYFCIFEDCAAPFDVPNTFEGLLGHMHSHLPDQWHVVTPDGPRKFDDQEDFERYVRDQGDIPESQLPNMVELSRSRGALFFPDCAFCGGYPDIIEKDFPEPRMPGAQEALRKHIKQHLHNIALFLPPDRDDLIHDEDNDNDASSDATGHARSEKDLDDSEAVTTCGREDCDCRSEDKSELGGHLDDNPWWRPPALTDSDFWLNLFADSRLDVSRAEASYDPRADQTLMAFLATMAQHLTITESNFEVGEPMKLETNARAELRETDVRLREIRACISCRLDKHAVGSLLVPPNPPPRPLPSR